MGRGVVLRERPVGQSTLLREPRFRLHGLWVTKRRSCGAMKTLTVKTRAAWRSWLNKHSASSKQIWLVFHKRHTGRFTLSYNDAVEEG